MKSWFDHHLPGDWRVWFTLIGVIWLSGVWQTFAASAEITTVQTTTANAVWLCHRPVDDWQVQLVMPGVEHYSIWIPAQKLHRGLVPDYPLGPLRWGDEVYLDGSEDAARLASLGLQCEPVPAANSACVAQQITRQQDEGVYTFTNHCQTKIVEILTYCGGEVPLFLPANATLSPDS